MESQYVVKLKKAIKTDARYYMFMEYCNGGDLKDLMEIKRWSPNCDIIQTIMKQLVQGFNDMISVLVIHRDLKPDNILMEVLPNGKKILKVGDFGISKIDL